MRRPLPLVEPEILADPAIYPPPEVRARLFPRRCTTPRTTGRMTRLWTKVRTGQ